MADGTPVAKRLRWVSHDKALDRRLKDFRWQRWEDGEWTAGLGERWQAILPIYHADKYMAAASDTLVMLTEGEHDADAGESLGYLTVTTGGTTGEFSVKHVEMLRGRNVVIVSHSDKAGRAVSERRAALLYNSCASVKIIEIPTCKDLAEAVEKGFTQAAIDGLIADTPSWKPDDPVTLLNRTIGWFRKYLVLREEQVIVLGVWVFHTHAFKAATRTLYTPIVSPEGECGKSRVLEVLIPLVARAWYTSRTTVPVLYRTIEEEHPTLLFDEADRAFRGDANYQAAIIGVFNSGYSLRGNYAACETVGKQITRRTFSTFCPKAIAGINKLDETIAKRAIVFEIERAAAGSLPDFFEEDYEEEVRSTAAKIALWCAEFEPKLAGARPEMPTTGMSDRQKEASRPLVAIADAISPEIGERFRKALVKIFLSTNKSKKALGTMALEDIFEYMHHKDDLGDPSPPLERAPSGPLVTFMIEKEDRPWALCPPEHKPLTPARFSRILEPYHVMPTRQKVNGTVTRCYDKKDLLPAWNRYTPWVLAIKDELATVDAFNRPCGVVGRPCSSCLAVRERLILYSPIPLVRSVKASTKGEAPAEVPNVSNSCR